MHTASHMFCFITVISSRFRRKSASSMPAPQPRKTFCEGFTTCIINIRKLANFRNLAQTKIRTYFTVNILIYRLVGPLRICSQSECIMFLSGITSFWNKSLNTFIYQWAHPNYSSTSWRQSVRIFVYNSPPPEQNGCHFADDIFRCSFVIKIFVFWLKFQWHVLYFAE